MLGQSFGGLCVFTYLSLAPEGLREAFTTGGVPGIGTPIDDVYRATYARMSSATGATSSASRRIASGCGDLVARLDAEDVRLPSGDRLTSRRLRTLGSHARHERRAGVRALRARAAVGSPAFLHDAADPMGLARNPIYAALHEACWADGGVTSWSAQRMLPDELELTGEHIYPWMFEEYGALAPLRAAAEQLAGLRLAAPLRPGRAGARTPSRSPSAIYTEDLYVERAFSEETAAIVPNLHAWVTSEYDHNGLRADGERILSRLIDLVRGRA